MSALRVLQADPGREWRGGQNQVRLLVRELAGTGAVEQRLVTRTESELARRAAAEHATVVAAGWGAGLDPRALWTLAREIRAFRPDIVHAHNSHALWLALLARRLAGRAGAPRIVATRRAVFPVRRSGSWFRADHIVAISHAVRRALVADGLPDARVTVVHSGVDPDEIRRAAGAASGLRGRLGLSDGVPLAINVAALTEEKDHRTLIRAAQIARALRPELHWAIAGDGKLRRALESEIAALGLAGRVRLLGYVAEADAAIREADVFVMSSTLEGLGTVVLHALALEKPVVATRGGGLPEMLPGRCLVDVGDAAALAQAVVQALDHPTPVPLPPQFTAAEMARGALAVYRSLI